MNKIIAIFSLKLSNMKNSVMKKLSNLQNEYNLFSLFFYKSIITIIILFFLFPLVLFSADNLNFSKNQQVKIISILKDNEQQLNLLTARVRDLIDNYSLAVQSINKLNSSLKIEKNRTILLERKISILQQQVLDDRKQVKKSIDDIVDKVAVETSKSINTAIKKVQYTNRVKTSKSIKSTNVDNDRYTEYKVQPGATLSAISKAYRVSVSSIRKANNLSGDFIKIGQVLRIPNKSR